MSITKYGALYSKAIRAAIEPLECRLLLTSVVVNTTTDIIYPSGSGLVSLRNAVATANASSTPTTITFDPTVFSTPKTITLSNLNGRLDIEKYPAIVGPAAGVAISGQNVYVGGGANTTFSNVTITDELVNNGGTAALTNSTLIGSNSSYGCFNLDGTTTLTNVTVSGSGNGTAGIFNESAGGTGVMSLKNVVVSRNFSGGIISTRGGVMTLIGVTISDNSNGSSGANNGGQGAGFYNNGTATLTNVTISGNTAYSDTAATDTDGGAGIYNDTDGKLTLRNVTISGNTESGGQNTGAGGGGISNFAPAANVTIGNTIVAGNAASNIGPDVYGGFTSLGHNLIGKTDASSGWIAADQTGTIASPLNAKLGGLANNGGTTDTLLPLTGSPAIDHGSNALIPGGIATDQRSLPRIVNGIVDIGAAEVQTAATVKITVTPPAAQAATQGQSKSFPLGSFSQTNAIGPFTVTWTWGDGSASTSISLAKAGTIPAAAHTYAATGSKTVTVSVKDSTGHSNSATFVVTVTAAQTGSISGRVFDDVNGNGLRDPGEAGLGLFTVYIDSKNSGKFGPGDPSVITDVLGNWSFTGLAAGTYVIRVVPVTGLAATKPSGAVLTIKLTAGQKSVGNLIGEKATS